jgi:AraC-like DNA-binding protein
MAEPRVVVAHREELWWLLAEASQLEHMIMCQYLFADFGLKRAVDEGLAREQPEVLARWSRTLHQIAVEEMLHLALAADLLREPGATLEAVARQVGYGSPFALSAAFKRVRGVSPRAYAVSATA